MKMFDNGRRNVIKSGTGLAALFGLSRVAGATESPSRQADYSTVLQRIIEDVKTLDEAIGDDFELREVNGVLQLYCKYNTMTRDETYVLGSSAPNRLVVTDIGHAGYAFIPQNGKPIQFTDNNGQIHKSPYMLLGQVNLGLIAENPSEKKGLDTPWGREFDARMLNSNTRLMVRPGGVNRIGEAYRQILENLS